MIIKVIIHGKRSDNSKKHETTNNRNTERVEKRNKKKNYSKKTNKGCVVVKHWRKG